MTNRIHVAVALISFAAGSTMLLAQPQPSTIPPGARTISLDVVVTPKSGKPVAGLTQQDFTVLDNKVARPITSFAAAGGPQAPVDIILVIDAVNTGIVNLGYEREQIDRFLTANGGHLAHPLSVALFTDTGTTIQHNPSTDGNEISKSLDQSVVGLREIRRDSDYGGQDRLNLSLKTMHSLIDKVSGLRGRKLIFWISPGWPLLSGPEVDLDAKEEQQIFAQVVGLSTLLRRNDITLYSIDPLGAGQSVAWQSAYEQFLDGVKSPEKVSLGNLALQVLAVQSGGLALSATNDTARHLEQCMDDTAAYYRITYEAPPAERPNEYHGISVGLSTSGLAARTRTGYYAQP